jgi:molecular chaperone GrpE
MDDENPEPLKDLPPPGWPPRDPSEKVDVAFVVPAEAYESIATVDGLELPETATGDGLGTIEGETASFLVPELVPREIPAPIASGPSAELLEIRELNDAILKRMGDLHAAFEREVRAETTREKVIDRLHAELQEYKQDLLLNTLRPVFIDLIQLHDDIGKLIQSQESDEGHATRLSETMRGFQQGIEDILYRQGVEPFELDGVQFDPRRQRAASTVATDDATLAKTVASRLRKGFQAGEKLIRPEIVSVYAIKR